MEKKNAAICFLLRFFGLAAISEQMCVQQQNGWWLQCARIPKFF